MSLANTAVIGKLPGYNINIDKDRDFQKNLLKGVTFIDLFPTTYTFFTSKDPTAPGANESRSTTTMAVELENWFETFTKLLTTESGLFKRETKQAIEMYSGALTRLKTEYPFLGSTFDAAQKIRIVAANDSTFTESFSSSYGNDNGIVGLYDKVKGSKFVQWGHMYKKGIASMSHANLQELVGKSMLSSSLGGSANWSTLLEGAAFGMNLAAPQMWNSSQYNSNLTVFVKLISPVGTEECIQQNILKPLMYLLAASSPISATGMMSGVPMLWEVQAHGVTNFRLGAITNMTVIRGSFETTFNQKLQPTILDVRLTITPLMQDFAIQSNTEAKSIYTKTARNSLGAQNPSDVMEGSLNTSHPLAEEIVSIKL